MPDTAFSEKLYTSTEVAQILGVSLRSIYRYLDENKIQAAVKTATGRHRFTKDNINDFLHPSERPSRNLSPDPKISDDDQVAPVAPVSKLQEVDRKVFYREPDGAVKKAETPAVEKDVVKDEPVDWLARFRQAAEKYKTQEVEKPQVSEQVWEEPKVEKVEEESSEAEFYYYRSGVGGLKEIAQSLDKSAKNASLDYAFTMQAGLSLHKPIKPFSLIHAYIKQSDKSYFERVLQLTPAIKDTAQLCLIASDDINIYKNRKEIHSLQVVADDRIKLDLLNDGETDLANELA